MFIEACVVYMKQASTLRIDKPPLRNKIQTANTDNKHINQHNLRKSLPYQLQARTLTK